MKPSLPVVLASASPRRRELLRQLIDDFVVVPADIDEDAMTLADPWLTAQRLAEAKALAVSTLHPESLVIGSDTVVAYERLPGSFAQLSKPVDQADAVRILRELSGREHLVITGVAVCKKGQVVVDADTTKVRFRELSDAEIGAYVETEEPMDKAGAYAIQGGAAEFVESTEGSISNVIGLPLELLEHLLLGFSA